MPVGGTHFALELLAPSCFASSGEKIPLQVEEATACWE